MIGTVIDPGTALASCFHALSKSKACWFSINTDFGGYSLASALQLSLSDTAYLLFTLGLVSKAKRGNKLTMNTSKWDSYLILHNIKNAKVNQFKLEFGSERMNFLNLRLEDSRKIVLKNLNPPMMKKNLNLF